MSSGVAHSIVLLSYNAVDLLPACISSIVELRGGDGEVIVVENASEDGSRELVRRASEQHGWVYEPLGENIGYARGMNAGFARASGEIVIPLNCDAILDAAFIEEASRALTEFPDAGAIAPRVRRSLTDGVDDQDDGSVIRLRAGMRVAFEDDAPRGSFSFKSNGAAPVLRRSALQQIGAWPEVFDPTFDTYGEDVDLFLRLWAGGWTVRYVPSMKAVHRRSRGRGDRMWMKRGRHRRNIFRGRWYNALMHSPGSYLARDLSLIAAQDVGVTIARALTGDVRILGDVTGAWRDVVRNRAKLRTRRHSETGRLTNRMYRRLTRVPQV